MPDISILIKPASGACNLRCRYCFYADEAMNRSVPSYGLMSHETLEKIILRAFETDARTITFGFQGGEPTLCGLDFFKKAVELQKKHAKKGVIVNNAIQTNGLLIDDQWAQFLAENKFLTGLSVDGFSSLHDLHRVDAQGKGSFSRAMKAAETLKKHKAEFNVLTVVTAAAARKAQKIYSFYRKNDLLWQQYIPCLDPLGQERGQTGYALTPSLYASFLKTLFDLWYEDICAGRFIYIRYFENLVGMLAGYPPESCGLSGRCGLQFVAEADGSMYPCDFYVLDQHKMGNVYEHSLDEMARSKPAQDFLAAPFIHKECAFCRFLSICRGGCRRDRDLGGRIGLNYFCPAYQEFFEYALPRMLQLAQQLGR